MASSYTLPYPDAYEAPAVLDSTAHHNHGSASTSPVTVQSPAPAIGWLWTEQGRDWTTAGTGTDQAALNLARPSIWTWTAEDELAHQQILAKRAAEEYLLQRGLSSLDSEPRLLEDVSTSPSEDGGAVEITFDEVCDDIQGIFTSLKKVDDVVEYIARWADKLDDNIKPEYLELFLVTCEIFAHDRWGPEQNLRILEGNFTWNQEASRNIQAAYLFAELWAKLYRHDLISFDTFNRGCAILWCDCNECNCDEEELEILEHVYTTALKLTEPPFYCSELEHVEAQLRAVRRVLSDRTFEKYLEWAP